MGTIQISEHTKLSNVDERSLVAGMADRERSMVYLWDCGPANPKAPVRPSAPKGKEGDPDFDLAMVDFRKAILDYEDALKAYGVNKAEFAQFDRQWGGPYEIRMWSADAKDAFANDQRAVDEGRQPQKRFFISARTRGYEKLPNGGLPGNLKPGRGHFDNLEREAAGEAEGEAMRRADPVFGNQEMRA